MGINHTNKHLIDANERLHQAPSLQHQPFNQPEGSNDTKPRLLLLLLLL